jgi:hypothetical protein
MALPTLPDSGKESQLPTMVIVAQGSKKHNLKLKSSFLRGFCF